MECLSDIKIHDYVEGSLTAVEKSIVRDHLILCAGCRARYGCNGEYHRKKITAISTVGSCLLFCR